MAIVRAVKSGNWSDTTVWNTGALPTSADDVYSNTFTVTIDQSATVLSIRNTAATGVTAGGGFQVTANAIALAADLIHGAVTLLTVNLTTPNSIFIVGSLTAGSNLYCVNNTSSGTVNITGNCGGIGSGGQTIANSAGGTINITGNLTSAGTAIASNLSNGTINITGTCTAANANNGWAVDMSNSSGTINIVGALQSSNASPAVRIGLSSATAIFTGPFLTSGNGVNPIFAQRWFWANSNVSPTYYQIRTQNLATIRPLYTADSVGGNPAVSNVRSGTVYGPSNELTGTCAVPGASSVLSGVPVDNTTGTATISAASIRSALGLASANLDTQLAAIPTTAAPSAATVASQVRTELAPELGNLDATVSSRLPSSGYTSPPSAASIASAVWSAATRTLTTAIDNSSTIATAVWSAVSRTITGGTVDTLTNAPSVPSAATIASQVRTELSAELGRIDATVSSRLAPGGTLARVTLTDTVSTLTNAPDVPTEAEIADAVRTELAPELARMANAATTQEVGDIVEGALD